MALSLLVPLLLGGVAVAEAGATAQRRRKPDPERPEAGPRRSAGGASPTDSNVRVAYRALVRGDMPDPVPNRLARGLDCLLSGIIAPLGREGVSGKLVPLVDPRGRTSVIRDGLAFGLTLDRDSSAPAPVAAALPGVEAMPPDPTRGRDFWIFALPDLQTGAALLDHLSVYGAPVVAMAAGSGGTGLDVDQDGTADFYFDSPGAPGSSEAGAVDFSNLPRTPV